MRQKMLRNAFRIMVLYLSFLAIIFLVIYSRLKNKDLEDIDTSYKAKADSIQKEYNIRLKEKDSLLNIIHFREADNKKLFKEIEDLRKQIKEVENKPITVPEKPSEVADYFNSRYLTSTTKVERDKIVLVELTAKQVVTELEIKDRLKTINSLQEVELFNNNQIISNLEKDKDDYKNIYLKAEKEIDNRIRLQQIAERNINTLKQENKNLNKKNTILKYTLPAATIIGGFVGFQISK